MGAASRYGAAAGSDEFRHPARRNAAVEGLFPPGVVAFESRRNGPPDDLLPAEREYIAKAVPPRVREFAAGRRCARAALAALGFEPGPVLAGADRAPIWPRGAVGSITHTGDYCLVVAARAERFSAIGVDAERVGHLDVRLWPLTMRAAEIAHLESLPQSARAQAATMLFGAKEAFYKCQHALTGTWLGFEDVAVRLETDGFELVVLARPHPVHRFGSVWAGRFVLDGPVVITGIAVEHRASGVKA